MTLLFPFCDFCFSASVFRCLSASRIHLPNSQREKDNDEERAIINVCPVVCTRSIGRAHFPFAENGCPPRLPLFPACVANQRRRRCSVARASAAALRLSGGPRGEPSRLTRQGSRAIAHFLLLRLLVEQFSIPRMLFAIHVEIHWLPGFHSIQVLSADPL